MPGSSDAVGHALQAALQAAARGCLQILETMSRNTVIILVQEKELEEQRSVARWKADAAANLVASSGNIQIRDEQCDDAKAKGDPYELQALSVIPVPYFMLPWEHVNRPVYKQASNVCHNPAFIFHYDAPMQSVKKPVPIPVPLIFMHPSAQW